MQKPHDMLLRSALMLFAYMSSRKEEDRCVPVWHVLLSEISKSSEPATALALVLDAADKGLLSEALKPRDGELDELCRTFLEESLQEVPSSPKLVLLRRVFKTPGIHLSP
jgi:hypothetical protein